MASKDHHDPGWNDPPIFTYDKATAIQNAAKKGISLNKRVAFPISGKVESTTAQGNLPLNASGKPPMTQQPPLPPISSTGLTSVPAKITDLSNTHSELESLGKDKLEDVLKNLQFSNVTDEEIVKRIGIMEKMWIEDKLDVNVKVKILELSEALANGDTDSADHIQKSLMVDKISQCSTWMSGIRHLINLKRLSKS